MSELTLEQQLRYAIDALQSTSSSASIDAIALAMIAFGRDRAGLIRDGQATTTEANSLRFQSLVERRLNGEPVAYLSGLREFWSLRMVVNNSVLIPRPESELLVEQALVFIDDLPGDNPVTVVDLGTGSGAIAIAIAHERSHCRVLATDRSQTVLDVASHNAEYHRTHNVEFLLSDWFDAVTETAFDLIVSNPPYIATDDPHLNRGDVAHEPSSALVSGVDGLDALRSIIASAPEFLKQNGMLLLEHGHEQGSEVRALCRKSGFGRIRTHRDLADRERVTQARLN